MKANNTANYLAAVAINDGFRRPADRFDSGKKVVVVDVAKGEDLTLYQRALLRVDGDRRACRNIQNRTRRGQGESEHGSTS